MTTRPDQRKEVTRLVGCTCGDTIRIRTPGITRCPNCDRGHRAYSNLQAQGKFYIETDPPRRKKGVADELHQGAI